MSMSTHIVGFRPADEQWDKMKQVWDSCEAAGINPPSEVMAFFEYENPGDKPGKEVSLGSAVNEWNDEYRQGYQVDLLIIPVGVRYLRFYNVW